MEQNKNTWDLYVGEPGAGKSFLLTTMSLNDKLLGKSVFIMCPTIASKQNIQSEINRRLHDTSQGLLSEQTEKALQSLIFDVHVQESQYKGQTSVYIDEIGQTSTTVFYSLLHQMVLVNGVHVHLMGDIKQLQPAGASLSPLESLMRTNINEPLWKFVSSNCYEDFSYDTFKAPELWQIKEPISVHLLSGNHRLRKLGYQSYNNEFFDAIVAGAIEADDYSDYLIDAVNKNSAILVATKSRGRQVDEVLINHFGSIEYMTKAPFIELQGKTYLNPLNSDYDQLKIDFAGMPIYQSTGGELGSQQPVFKFWATVHSMQGISVNGVTFYMGNDVIGNGHVSHYSQNLLYTSVTRARDEITLLGRQSEFAKMRHQEPETPQRKYGYKLADEAQVKLFNLLLDTDGNVPYDFTEIYHMYEDLFYQIKPDNKLRENLEAFAVSSEPYTEIELKRAFKSYPSRDAIVRGFKPNYKALVYDKYLEEVRATSGSAKRGRGKVQQYIQGLTPEQLSSLKEDVERLSVRKFQAKYKMVKKSIVSALEELDIKQSA